MINNAFPFHSSLQDTDWSVMLRKNWQNNDNIRKIATCHGAIPDLSPARYHHGVAAIDYTLYVCGGMVCKLSSQF